MTRSKTQKFRAERYRARARVAQEKKAEKAHSAKWARSETDCNELIIYNREGKEVARVDCEQPRYASDRKIRNKWINIPRGDGNKLKLLFRGNADQS